MILSRNQNSHFATLPNVNIGRSTFNRDSGVTFSFDVGAIVPFYLDECVPGDTFQIKTSKVVRLQTPITPFMGNLYLDTYYFFVPNRLVDDHWVNVMGENTQSAWYSNIDYEVPQIEAPSGGWNIGTIADYFGIPTGVDGISVSALPFRAYALICDQWFRDENLSDPLVIPKNDTTVTGVNSGTFVTDVAKGGLPYTAAKYRDYFTAALPYPQKGPDTTILSGDSLYPVVLGDIHSGPEVTKSAYTPKAGDKMHFSTFDNSSTPSWDTTFRGNQKSTLQYNPASSTRNDGSPVFLSSTSTAVSTNSQLIPTNLWADPTWSGTSVTTVNQLRMAFQLQKLYERDARGGTRYNEIIKSHFGVTSPDSRLQRAEYLGGNRLPINVSQVIQNSETGTTPQGTAAAYSLTTDSHGDFIRSFTEHGLVIGVCVARYDHTYQQGLERMWSRKDRFDFYWPVLANLGEQEIKNKEIYCTGTSTDEEVFGYQERWAEYRYKPSRVCGEMRSAATTSLDVWHLADNYNALPTLSDSWIREDKSNVDRVLAVTSAVSNQLMADFWIQNKSTRPMPMYSVPGLIDHN